MEKDNRYSNNDNFIDDIEFDDSCDFDVDNTDVFDKSDNAKKDIGVSSDDRHTELSKRDRKKIIKQNKKLRQKNKKYNKADANSKSRGLKYADSKKTSVSTGNRFSLRATIDRFSSDNRRVLSYEDLPIDEREEILDSKASGLVGFFRISKKKIIAGVSIILLLVVVVFILSNSDRFTYSNIKNWLEYGVLNTDKDERFPVEVQGDSVCKGNFTRMSSNLVYSSDTQYVTMNSYGKSIFSFQQSFSNPVLVTASDADMAIVYNLGGKGYAVHSLEQSIYSGNAENNIMVADIAKNGTYALVTQSDGYLSKLYVYSDKNDQIFAYSFADYYITSVSVNSDGSKAVLSGVSADNGSEICAVYVLDFTEKEPVVFNEFDNNIIYQVKFLTDKYVCAIGKTATYGLNVRTGEFTTTDYKGKNLTAFDINPDTGTFCVSLSRSGDGRKCDILCFSSYAELKNTIQTSLKITSLSSYKDRIAALDSDNIYLYNNSGSELSVTNAGIDPIDIVLYSKNDVYVLGVSEITRLDL